MQGRWSYLQGITGGPVCPLGLDATCELVIRAKSTSRGTQQRQGCYSPCLYHLHGLNHVSSPIFIQEGRDCSVR